MKKVILTTLLASSLVVANGIYSQNFIESSKIVHSIVKMADKSQSTVDRFANQKAFHYPSLSFDDALTSVSKEILDSIIDKINKSNIQSYTVTLIGYTSTTIDPNESVKLNAWSAFWQSLASSTTLTSDESISMVNSNLNRVVDYLIDHGIRPNKIYTENRMGKEKLYTEAISSGRELNNRVDIALYGVN